MSLDLLLFTVDLDLAQRAVAAGVDKLVVDWESSGKSERQAAYDTEINRDGPADLERLRQLRDVQRYCRVNRLGPESRQEIDLAIHSGATHLLLPMVESPAEVERYLALVNGRAGAGILVETAAACACAAELAAFPVDPVYVGLNDLRISRDTPSIFTALIDGTLERLRGIFSRQRFGFGGLTVLDGGKPIACARLLEEMARLACDLTFLRRSFKRDIPGRDMRAELELLRSAYAGLRGRAPDEERRDHAKLRREIELSVGAA